MKREFLPCVTCGFATWLEPDAICSSCAAHLAGGSQCAELLTLVITRLETERPVYYQAVHAHVIACATCRT